MCRMSWKSWSLNLLEPSGPHRACYGTPLPLPLPLLTRCIARSVRDGTRAETRFRLSSKRTNPFKSEWASVQSTAASRGVRISLINAGYTTFGDGLRVLATQSIRQFPLHFPSRASPCATRFRTSSTLHTWKIHYIMLQVHSLVHSVSRLLFVRAAVISFKFNNQQIAVMEFFPRGFKFSKMCPCVSTGGCRVVVSYWVTCSGVMVSVSGRQVPCWHRSAWRSVILPVS